GCSRSADLGRVDALVAWRELGDELGVKLRKRAPAQRSSWFRTLARGWRLPEVRCCVDALDCLLAMHVAQLTRPRRRVHRRMKRLSVLLKNPPVPDTQMRPADHPHRATAEMTDDGIAVMDELADRRVIH